MTEEKKQTPRNTIAWIGGGAITLFDAIQALISIADRFGIPLDGAFLWMANNSWWLFPIGVLSLGIFIGWQLKKWRMAKQNITAEHIQELEEELTKWRADDAEREFRSMSFSAKGLCYSPVKDGVREISGDEDALMDYDQNDWKEAVEAGFILIEECGTHRHRIHATKKLNDLMEENPELLDEVYRDLINDLTESFVIRQTMDPDGKMSPPRVVDKFTNEESDRWRV